MINLIYTLFICSCLLFILQLVDIYQKYDLKFDINQPIYYIDNLISLKGLNFFIMGFSIWIILTNLIGWSINTSILINAVLIGIGFMILFYFLDKCLIKIPKQLNSDLIGTRGIIVSRIFCSNEYRYIIHSIKNPNWIVVYSPNKFYKGNIVTIREKNNEKYYI